MTAGVVIENYRQLAFVSSLLAGFAFTFYGVLLTTSTAHRVASWACFLAVAASIIFLLVTLGNTLAAVVASSLPRDNPMPPSIAAQKTPLDSCFLFGIALLFASFGLGGWIRSRQLGVATTVAASVGLACAFVVLIPYISIRWFA
jgi:hypothetical protein